MISSLFQALDNVLEKATAADKTRISRYLLYLINTANIEGLASRILDNPSCSSLFSEMELAVFQEMAASDEIELPNLLLYNDWGIPPMLYIRTYNLLKKERKKY